MTAMASTAKVASPCRGCRTLTRRGSGYCATCQPAANARHFNPAYNDPRYRERRARTLAEHRRLHGDWCPGYGVPAHASSDLTTDHPLALANDGTHDQPFGVLCRSCNGRKGAR